MSNKFRGRFIIQGNRLPINIPEFLTADLPDPAQNQWKIAIATDGAPDGGATTVISDGIEWSPMDAGGGAEFSGARVIMNPKNVIPNLVFTKLLWGIESFDDGDWYDTGGDLGVFTVPAGVTRVNVFATINWDGNAVGTRRQQIVRNGSQTLTESSLNTPGAAAALEQIALGPYAVAEGDTFQINVLQDTGGNLDANTTNASFSIEAVG